MSTLKTNKIENVAGTSGYDVSASFSFRNKLINGGFDVWQRGTDFVSPSINTYTADRWYTKNLVDRVYLHHTAELNRNGIRIVKTNNTAIYAGIAQGIESPIYLRGKEITISFKVRILDSISSDATITTQWRSSGDLSDGSTASTTWDGAGIDINNITTIQDGKITFTVPDNDVNGYMLRTCFFGNGITPTDTFEFILYDVQFEEGSVATPFEVRHIGLEEVLCKRYFQTFTVGQYQALTIVRAASTTSASSQREQLDVPMRVTPTVTGTSSPNATAKDITNAFANVANCTFFITPLAKDRYMYSLTVASGLTNGRHYSLDSAGITASVVFKFDSEL